MPRLPDSTLRESRASGRAGAQKRGDGTLYEEGTIMAQFAKEFERSEEELTRLATNAEKDLSSWLREVKKEAVGIL